MKKMLEKLKNNKSSLALVILALVLIIAGISFALFSPSINLLGRRNIKISKCELDINFKESDELMLVSKYPISTRQALEGDYKPKTVTITNNSTCDMAYYKLTIKDLINSSINKDVIQYHVVDKQNTMTYKLGDGNGDGKISIYDANLISSYQNEDIITYDYIKYALDVNEDGILNDDDKELIKNYVLKKINTFPAGDPLTEKTTTKEIIDVNPDTFLIENSIEKGQTHEYEIIMWISNAATNTDLYVNGDTTKPIEYKYALNLEASDGSLAPNLDTSGANKPALTSNMIPVYYDSASNVWKKADVNNSDASNKWYDYDNKMWANAVTVTSTNRDTYLNASTGTTIPMSDINTMWVWIPRYTYTYLNTNTPQSINIKFEEGTNSSGTIKCTDAVTGTSSRSETCTDTTNGSLKSGTSTYTHPAFWWDKNDNNVRETGEELTGIWVGKFEVSSDTTCTASGSAVVGSGCNLQTIRPLIKPDVTSWRGAQAGTFFNGIQKMSATGNQYGFATTDETHMMKNMEWGAVTYLSHSKYGINKEIAINSANTYTTGCGPQSEGSTSSGSTCNGYTTALGQSASTTGNTSGVYDMSGGSWEYMMGNMVWTNGQQMSGNSTSSNYNSAFTGILYDSGNGTSFTGAYAFPDKRYYDKYSYGTSAKEYTRGKLGDATKEMAPTGTSGNWYSDYASFPYSSYPWFIRGGSYGYGASAGAFLFYYDNGSAYTSTSARAVLGVLD